MDLRFLAISDTHLGEETSLLSFPQGRQHLWRVLRDVFGGGGRFLVEDLVLVGDVPDRTLSSTSQIATHTSAFMQTLGSAADIRRCVYIPGNHDHTMWTRYCQASRGGNVDHGITVPGGEVIVEGGGISAGSQIDWVRFLLEVFLGYPSGSSWRGIEDGADFRFVVANPLYAAEHAGRTYAFTHGTHFRREPSLPLWLRKLADSWRSMSCWLISRSSLGAVSRTQWISMIWRGSWTLSSTASGRAQPNTPFRSALVHPDLHWRPLL